MSHSNIGYSKCKWKYILNIVKDKERYISESDISSSKHCHLMLKNTLVYIHLNIYMDFHVDIGKRGRTKQIKESS